MSKHQLSRSGKGLWQRIEEMKRSLLPRQVTVLRSEGIQVWVDSTTRYPSVIAGLPAGTVGWVLPLAGGKGLFIPRGFVPPIPFSARNPGTPTTSSVGTMAWFDANTPTLSIPAGTYEVWGHATIPVFRSSSGDMRTGVRIGGQVAQSHYGHTSYGFGGLSGSPCALNVAIEGLVVTSTGSVDIEFGMMPETNAGTISMRNAVMSGVFVRIS